MLEVSVRWITRNKIARLNVNAVILWHINNYPLFHLLTTSVNKRVCFFTAFSAECFVILSNLCQMCENGFVYFEAFFFCWCYEPLKNPIALFSTFTLGLDLSLWGIWFCQCCFYIFFYLSAFLKFQLTCFVLPQA